MLTRCKNCVVLQPEMAGDLDKILGNIWGADLQFTSQKNPKK